jgi:hypothetical protein
MASTSKILHSIKEQCTGKIPSNDTRLEDRFILHQMNSVRAALVHESFRHGKIDDGFYQLKCCILVDCDRIVCSSLDSQEKVNFAYLPKLIEGIGWANIIYFGNVEFAKIYGGLHNSWDRYNMKGWLSMEYQEWIGRRPAFTIIGGYKAGETIIQEGTLALLKNLPSTGVKYLCVNGIFANPEDALCDEDDFLEMDYPLPSNMIHKLELIVIKQILSTEGVPGDDINNAKDNTANVVRPQQHKNIDPERYEQE